MTFLFTRAVLLVLAACWGVLAHAATLTGTVVGVHDGDTLTLLTAERETVKVRLAQIDAPELGQPYGQAAKKALSGAVFQRAVRIESEGSDRYGRTLGTVFLGAEDVNRRMIQDGAAWAYRRYLDDPELLEVEQAAQTARRGLWALQEDQRVPPWEWRKSRRKGS